ncbi:MAG: restriction endonuclease subunit S [Bacteroidales bacterium]|nr:restriction endonuclease subunit S [Bacteroidales bacterium]
MRNWDKKSLGEVCEIVNGSTPLRTNKDFWENGDYPWFTIDDIRVQGRIITDTKQKVTKAALSKLRVLPIDTVLLCCTASVGEYAITKIELATNQQFNGIVVKDRKKLDPEFLMHYCSTLKDKLLGLSGKTTIDFISISKLKHLEIPLPPLPEQQHIVSILDEAFAAIAKAKVNAEQNLKNAKELFESYLQGVFEKKGDSWEEKTIGEIGSPKMCKRIFKKETTSDGDIPFYKIGTFGKEPDAFISKELYSEYREKYSFPDIGAVLISASGTIGRRVRYNGEPAYFQDSNIVWIDNDESQVLNDYLYEFYGACNWGASKGATISRLYNDNLKRIKISFPKSRAEQQSLVRKLDALRAKTQKLEAVYQKKMDDLEELKKSILQKAFAGELKTENNIAL